MKFKEFRNNLSEKASYYKTISQLMSMSRIPLSDNITKSLGFGRDTIAFHATTIEHLGDLPSLGKSKKQISTFTKGLGSLIGSISVHPDVVAKLDGRSVIDFEFDIFSHPDPDGRRWIGTRGSNKSEFLQDAINTKPINLMFDLLHEQQESIPFQKPKFLDELIDNDTLYVEMFNKLNGKNKAKVIQLYISNVTNLVTKDMYKKIVMEIISGSNKQLGSYDEVIMNKFKVLGVYSIEAGRYKFDTSMAQYDIEKLGLKYLGHITKEDFRNFSNKTF
jgi:hypothetical protein